MKYVLDCHTHTLVSGHAYNTIREMAQAAAAANLALLAITEHAPSMPGTCNTFYFDNLRILDRNAYAVPLLFGSELNILDIDGTVDLPQDLMEKLDINIASLHPPCFGFSSKKDCTNSILNVMKNPAVHIIGHLDDGRFPLDYDVIAKAAKEHHTLLEVNNSSLLPTGFRLHAKENYAVMLKACEKYDTSVILNSDAHADIYVGRHDMSGALLKELDFPEDLVVNTSVDKLKKFLT